MMLPSTNSGAKANNSGTVHFHPSGASNQAKHATSTAMTMAVNHPNGSSAIGLMIWAKIGE